MRRNILKTCGVAYLTQQITSMLDTENLWCVPGIAADTLQPVQVILVEDLRREPDRFSLSVEKNKKDEIHVVCPQMSLQS